MNRVYPSRRAVFVAAMGVPFALLTALANPVLWPIGPAWVGVVLIAMLVDWTAGPKEADLTSDLPSQLGMGRPGQARFALTFRGPVPKSAEVVLEGSDKLRIAPTPLERSGKVLTASFALEPLRRGQGRLDALWSRWTGPLGLIWLQRRASLTRMIPIIPDMETVREEALRLFRRGVDSGLHSRLNRGLGTEFHALRDFQFGHDPRQIDWKQSARHNALVIKEYRVEQNQHLVAMLDTGRLMSDPLLGQPRLDHALHAILLLFYVGLKLGDRVGLCAFDSQPRLNSGTVSGIRSFPALQKLAATLDYSTDETNFTFGLTQLSAGLEHRSVIFLFTDFADPTSAELMLENVRRLLDRHIVLFVLFRDEELEEMRQREPQSAQDATRAVIADRLLAEREKVLCRLVQMGVHIIDAPVGSLNAGVLNAYLALKQRGQL